MAGGDKEISQKHEALGSLTPPRQSPLTKLRETANLVGFIDFTAQKLTPSGVIRNVTTRSERDHGLACNLHVRRGTPDGVDLTLSMMGTYIETLSIDMTSEGVFVIYNSFDRLQNNTELRPRRALSLQIRGTGAYPFGINGKEIPFNLIDRRSLDRTVLMLRRLSYDSLQ